MIGCPPDAKWRVRLPRIHPPVPPPLVPTVAHVLGLSVQELGALARCLGAPTRLGSISPRRPRRGWTRSRRQHLCASAASGRMWRPPIG